MNQPLRIVGIAGSLRSQSYSRLLLRAIAGRFPTPIRYCEIDIGGLPFYNEDLDRADASEPIREARQLVAAADAVIMVTPEFNHGIPGVLKNTLDWLSRPAFASCFLHKPVMFATISPGALGGVRAQYQLRETLSSMLCQLYPLVEIAVTHVGNKLDGETLTDQATIAHIDMVLASFLKQAGLSHRAAA